MRKFLLICCLLVGIASVSHAQSGQKLSADDRIIQLQKQLALNKTQTAQISAIYKAARIKLDAIIAASHGNKEATMNATRPLGEATDEKIKAVLTTKQATEFETLRKESTAKTSVSSWSAS
jgi:protein CpxP